MESFQSPEVLYTLAEISIAVVGFTGVIVALRFNNSIWSDVQKVRFSALTYPSLTALVSCFFPDIISYFTASEANIWRASNLGIALLHVTNLVSFYLLVVRSEFNPATKGQKLLGLLGGLTIVAHLLAAANIVSYLEVIFIFGVMQQIGIGIHNFVLALSDPEKH